MPGPADHATNPPLSVEMDDKETAPGTFLCMDDNHHTAIEARIAAYTPTTLDLEVWNRLATQIRDQVRTAGPHNVEDAKSLLVTLCQYLEWRDRQGLPIDDVGSTLEEAAIGAYAAARAATASPKTVGNHLGRLRRLHRRHCGVPDPAPSPRSSVSRRTPYSPTELAALRSAANAELDRALDLGLATGVVIPDAHTHPDGYDRAAWNRARGAARTAGVRLDSVRLHATWAHQQAHLAIPAAQLIRAGLTTADLDAIARATGTLSIDQLAQAR